VGGKSERVARETVEGAGREERVWLEGVARVAPGYTLRALVGFSRRYIPCRGHHSGPPICTDSARVVRRYIHIRESTSAPVIPRGFDGTCVGQHMSVYIYCPTSKCVSRCA